MSWECCDDTSWTLGKNVLYSYVSVIAQKPIWGHLRPAAVQTSLKLSPCLCCLNLHDESVVTLLNQQQVWPDFCRAEISTVLSFPPKVTFYTWLSKLSTWCSDLPVDAGVKGDNSCKCCVCIIPMVFWSPALALTGTACP